MKITRKKVEASVEKQILIGLITSREFCQRVRFIYKPQHIQNSYIKRVADWCLEYFQKYDKPIGEKVQETFNHWMVTAPNEAEADNIQSFLASLSDEYERGDKFNTEYVLDRAEMHFKAVSLARIAEDIQSHLSNDNVKDAEATWQNYKRIEKPLNEGVNPLTDAELIFQSFDKERIKPLFEFPGAYGEMINEFLIREGFIAFMGPEKSGKTWELMSTAILANKFRCNVALFQAGDMSEKEQIRRVHIHLAKKSNREKYCGSFTVPCLDCMKNQKNMCRMKNRSCRTGIDDGEGGALTFEDAGESYEPCCACVDDYPDRFIYRPWKKWVHIETPLDAEEAIENGKFLDRITKKKRLRMVTYPNNTLTITRINMILDTWEEQDNFIPDVVIIDYADILLAETNGDKRDQENEKWKELRALCQVRKALLVTATQTNAGAYNKELITEGNFSEDKRKYSHVTGIVTLNSLKEERARGEQRKGMMFVREGIAPHNTVTVLQSLQQGQPHLASVWTPREEKKDER